MYVPTAFPSVAPKSWGWFFITISSQKALASFIKQVWVNGVFMAK